ncbi:MAG: hypothetical protein ACOY4D_06585 [Pseudomonadota bacterium]
MHVERLDWLAKNPRYTQRFALHAGKLCCGIPNRAVAEKIILANCYDARTDPAAYADR